jgi:hypothetical protein
LNTLAFSVKILFEYFCLIGSAQFLVPPVVEDGIGLPVEMR